MNPPSPNLKEIENEINFFFFFLKKATGMTFIRTNHPEGLGGKVLVQKLTTADHKQRFSDKEPNTCFHQEKR